jgi:lipoprotein-anchoring transpeptidase ErfK/SrfK
VADSRKCNNARLLTGLRRTRLVLICAAAAVLALPAAASATPAPPVSLEVKGHKFKNVLDKTLVTGTLANPGPGKTVTLRVRNEGHPLFTKKVHPNNVTGNFRMPLTVTRCCRYVVVAQQGDFSSRPARFRVKVPNGVGRGAQAKLFNKLLKKEGFHEQGTPKKKNWATDLAILAFRKTNKMSRNTKFSKKIFKMLLQGRGAFKPKHEKGRHVEVDISRQVMALIAGGKAVHVFHVSTGAPGTPTVRGKFHFYLRQPGYNSHAMYYSVYFYGGYATHGYDPVPTYNASHGCVRNPIPYSVFIYNWVQLGMPIYVYN